MNKGLTAAAYCWMLFCSSRVSFQVTVIRPSEILVVRKITCFIQHTGIAIFSYLDFADPPSPPSLILFVFLRARFAQQSGVSIFPFDLVSLCFCSLVFWVYLDLT